MSKGPEPTSRMKDLTEHTIDGEWVFRGKLLKVHRDHVRLPDGAETEREYIEHPGAVTIVPVLESGELVMVRQYRYPLRRHFVELPAGKLDPGEAPLECAKRELLEETGYLASNWLHFATTHPVVGYSDEHIEIYLARGLAYQGAKPDQDEHLEVFNLSLETALKWVREGRITDAKTIIGLFWTDRLLTSEWS